MDNPFFNRPILNSPYEYPTRHWELDDNGQPTNRVLDARRRVSFISQTQCYPYFLQEWGKHVWEVAERSPHHGFPC